jgi:hypothetical protein
MADITALYPPVCWGVFVFVAVLVVLSVLRLVFSSGGAREAARTRAMNRLIEHNNQTAAMIRLARRNNDSIKILLAQRDAEAAVLLAELNRLGGHTSKGS